jgi:predicted metal-dependent peptidase
MRGGILLPGLIEQQYVPAMAWDTSASMGQRELEEVQAQSLALMKQTGVDFIWMAQADAKVQQDFKLRRLKDIGSINLKGRGGTDFRPTFARLEKLRPRPDVFFYFTDGDGTAPEKPPRGIPVIWVIVSQYARKPADWGHMVVCSNDPETLSRVGF